MKYWKERRQKDLEIAMAIALENPQQGESHPKVRDIRAMVDKVDHAIASGNLTKCVGGGIDASGNPVGDFVKMSYLCSKWSGATGASVARAGEAPDLLPAELNDVLEGQARAKA